MAYVSRARQIRKLTTNNKTGDAYGITIPAWIAEEYKEFLFTLYVSGNNIILQASGTRI